MLWLQEISPARSGDQLSGLSRNELALAARAIGTIHAHFWNERQSARNSHLPVHRYNLAHETRTHVPKFRKLGQSLLPSTDRLMVDQIAAVITRALRCAKQRPVTLLHGDLRADNLIFSQSRIFIVDWQIAAWGLGSFDLARMIGGSSRHPLSLPEQKKLVGIWHQTLQRSGVRRYSMADAWQDYRIGVGLTLSIPVTNGPTLARLSPRGQKIARRMIQRFFGNGRKFGLL